LWALLLENHKAIYDEHSLRTLLEKAGFANISRQGFNQSSNPELQKEVFDTHPNISLTMECVKPAVQVVTPHKEKLRVILVSTPFIETPPKGYGGLEMVIWNLAVSLEKLGCHVTLVGAKGSQSPPNGTLIETVEPTMNVNWYEWEKKAYAIYEPYLKDFDIIHDSTWWGFPYLFKMEHPSVKLCHTHHGAINFKKPPPVEFPNWIAISNYMAEYYKKAANLNSKVVYNGIDTTLYPFSPTKGDRLLYVGRIVPYKQPHIAIEVAKKLGVGLDIVGFAWQGEQAYFEKVKALCDGTQIKFQPNLSHEEKIKLMQNAKALLFPSKMGEPYGLVCMESFSCGTPVIGTRDGAIPELIDNGVDGFLCDTVEEMMDAVKKIDSINPVACRRKAEQFDRLIMAKRYLWLYQDILKGSEW
jgi:glycosyltransferase involved in cell wall biosynthesis